MIVNWNAGLHLRECVESTGFAAGPRLHVVVVDNASTDDSLARLRGLDAAALTVIRNDRNVGFAAACNQGARAGAADYVLFLNPDARVSLEALEAVLAYMDSEAGQAYGICGVQLIDDHGEVARSCARHPTPWRMLGSLVGLDRVAPRVCAPHMLREWDHRTSRPVEQVIGAWYLVRRSLFERLGGFDERFFLYYEEVDFTWRAARQGWPAYYVATASAHHRGGATTDRVPVLRRFHATRSRIRYAFKHFPRPVAAAHLVGSLTVEPLMLAAVSLLKGDLRLLASDARAALRLWRELRTLPGPATPDSADRVESRLPALY